MVSTLSPETIQDCNTHHLKNKKNPPKLAGFYMNYDLRRPLFQLSQVVIVKGPVVIHRDKQAIFKGVV